MTLFIDIHDKSDNKFREKIRQLKPICGTCLFIDIINSTEIKYKIGFKEWITFLKNTFGMIALQNKIKDNIVKFIGDEIMIFVPDDVLFEKNRSISNYYTLLQEISATVDILKMLDFGKVYLQCNAAIHYCENVYNISFFKNSVDYYGKDIDLTARLLSKAKENRIVLSEKFYKKLLADLSNSTPDKKSECLKLISDKYIEDFKGIPHSTIFRFINI